MRPEARTKCIHRVTRGRAAHLALGGDKSELADLTIPPDREGLAGLHAPQDADQALFDSVLLYDPASDGRLGNAPGRHITERTPLPLGDSSAELLEPIGEALDEVPKVLVQDTWLDKNMSIPLR